MVLVLVGMLVAAVVDLASAVLSMVSLVRRARGLGVAALVLALVAILFNAFAWIVVLRGKDTRGEPITWRDDSELYVIVAMQCCVLVLAIIAMLRSSRRS